MRSGAEVDDGEPEEPKPEDCCGEGCNPCVYDIYRQQLKRFQAKKSKDNHDNHSGLSKIDFQPFRLIKIDAQNEDTSIYRFESDDVINLKIGQHLELKVPSNAENEAQEGVRKFSPISWTNTTFDVIIKRYTTGLASKYLEVAKAEDVMYWRGPYGDFKYNKEDQEQLVILCAGTGIAPMIPIISAIVEDDKDETMIKLLCGSHTLQDRLLLATLKQLAAFWNFSFTHYVTSSEGEPEWGEKVTRGRIHEADVLNAIVTQNKKCRVLICGSDSFCDDMKCFVQRTGVNFHCF